MRHTAKNKVDIYKFKMEMDAIHKVQGIANVKTIKYISLDQTIHACLTISIWEHVWVYNQNPY